MIFGKINHRFGVVTSTSTKCDILILPRYFANQKLKVILLEMRQKEFAFFL